MADAPIDAVGDQRVAIANLQCGRPVFPEVFVRFPKDPVTNGEDDNSSHANPQRDGMVREGKERREHVKKRNEEPARAHGKKE